MATAGETESADHFVLVGSLVAIEQRLDSFKPFANDIVLPCQMLGLCLLNNSPMKAASAEPGKKGA